MSNFQYKARSAEAWDKRASGKLYEGFAVDQFTTISLKDDNTIRILPPTWEDPQHYGIDLWVHYSVGPTNATVICINKMRGQKCPVCEAWARAEQAGRDDAKELKPTRRVLVWLIDRSDEKIPMLWAMPQTVDTQIAAICRDRMSGELYQIDHPDAGYDVFFQRKKKGGDAQFVEYLGFQLARRPTQVDEKFMTYILEHPLPTTLNWRTYEEIERLYLGGALNEEKPVAAAPQPGGQPQAPLFVAAQPPSSSVQPPANTPPPPVAVAPPPPPVVAAPPPPPPPPPKAFTSEYTGGHCSICSKPQYTTPDGITCEAGHYNVAALEEQKANGEVTASAPLPSQVASAQTSRTAALRERFNTGKK